MAGKALTITYAADASSALAAQKQIDSGHTKMQAGATKTGGVFKQAFGAAIPLASVAAGVAVVGLAKSVITAASDEGEALNKANVVFGNATDSVIKFSDQSASGFGISKAAALDAASGFGAMAQSAGLSEGASADMSVALVKLAGDMASFNNQDPSEMLERLRSGLAGEAEPLRQFGVFISEARVETEAYKLGIAEVGAELTDAQKIQARYNIIQQDTAKQAGDFGRTLGESLPNQLRVLKAEFTDLAADIGKQVLPVITGLVKAFGALRPVLEFAGENLDLIAAGFAAWTAFKYIEPMLLGIASGLEAIGAAGLSSGVLNLASTLGAGGAAAGGFVVAMGAVPVVAYRIADALAPVDEAQQRVNERMKEFGVVRGPGYSRAVDQAAKDLAEMKAKAALAEAGITNLTGSTDAGANSQDRYGREAAETTAELREQRLEVLAASDSFLGIKLAADDVAEAQRELNRLERQGKEDTKAYEQAVLDALGAQISFEDQIVSFGKEMHDNGVSTKDVTDKIRDMGKEFGLSKDDVRELIGEIRDYINAVKDVPKEVTTHFRTTYDPSGIPGQQLQHGGIVTRPTVALIGEAGPEAVIPLSKGRGMAGMTLNFYIAGSVVSEDELVDVVLTGIRKAGIRNVTAGIP